jgi:putative phosphoesterase
VNALTQLPSGLIASPEDALALEKAAKVRILLVSDSHGNSDVLAEIIRKFGAGADLLVHCGDGCADLFPLFLQAAKTPRIADTLPPVIAAVQGNGDADCFPLGRSQGAYADTFAAEEPQRLRFHVPRRLCFTAGGKTIFVAHGHGYGVDFGPEQITAAATPLGADLIFHGHTHRPTCIMAPPPSLIVNPGSCARPRGDFPPTFALLTYPGDSDPYSGAFIEVRSNRFCDYSFVPLDRTVR